jgi:hypothetical protein
MKCKEPAGVTESPDQKRSRTQTGGNKDRSIAYSILSFPGRVVSTKMLTRMHSALRGSAVEIKEWMISLDGNKGSDGYVGKYRHVGCNIGAFFKAKPQDVDRDFVQSFGLSWDEYSDAYDSNMEVAPCKVLAPNWKEYYATLLAASSEVDL